MFRFIQLKLRQLPHNIQDCWENQEDKDDDGEEEGEGERGGEGWLEEGVGGGGGGGGGGFHQVLGVGMAHVCIDPGNLEAHNL